MTSLLSRCLLRCIAALALLPGCQHLPYFGSAACEKPRETEPVATPKPPTFVNMSQPSVSTASPHESNAFAEPKLPVIPLPELDIKPQGPIANGGVPGVVHFEPGPEVPETQLTGGRSAEPPPLPMLVKDQRAYAAVAQALQDVLEGRHQDAVTRLQVYEKSTQEFFLRLLPALAILANQPLDKLSAQDIVVLNDLLVRLLETIRPFSELIVNKMCFCRRVNGYGAYEEMPGNHAFLSATPDRFGELVQLYVELKNFISEPTKGGDYLTKLACTLELKDARGEKVWGHTYQRDETTHRRRTRLNDLHSNFSFPVPAIPAGTYQLTIQIVDETLPDQRRVARKSLDFQVTPVANQPLR